jgi:hypothetical protein
MRILTLLLAALVISGCSDSKKDQQQETTAEAEARANEVLVEVNGHKLLMGEAITRMNKELGQPPQNLPSERIQLIRKRKLHKIINDFVMQTLLASEAERLEIEVTEDDEQEALKRLKANIPEGTTWEQYVGDEDSQAKLHASMTTAIRVQKLLGRLRTEKGDAPITDEDVKAYAKAINAEDAPRDMLEKRIRAQRERAMLETYLKELRGKATINHSAIVGIPNEEEPAKEEAPVAP